MNFFCYNKDGDKNMDDRIEKIKSLLKYVLPILVLIVILILVFSNKRGFNDIEKEMVVEAQKYISDQNIIVESEIYIEMDKLGEIDDTALCLKSSGVIVKNNGGSLEYIPYLKCDNYETNITNNKNHIIKLVGGEVIVLNLNEAFNDPLYTLNEDADVINEGIVYNEPGVYTLVYDAYIDGKLKERATRKVIRVANDKTKTISGLVDRDNPEIFLNGETNIVLSLGEKYDEKGYTAYDYEDGKISRQVKITGKVDTKKVGTYVLVYDVTNSKGNTAMKTRTVEVVRRRGDLDIVVELDNTGITNSNMVSLTINGSGYSKTILPDGRSDISRTIKFPVIRNGIYKFTIYD